MNYIYSDDEYARVISHEMGHIFGIDDGYGKNINIIFLGEIPIRPDAAVDLKLIGKDDIMRNQHNKLDISNTDIEMLILAYSDNEYQTYSDYAKQYSEQENKE